MSSNISQHSQADKLVEIFVSGIGPCFVWVAMKHYQVKALDPESRAECGFWVPIYNPPAIKWILKHSPEYQL